MKKGFTLVELVVTLTLSVTIALFLFQIILSLKDLYNQSMVQTDIISKQSIISNMINKKIYSTGLIGVEKCGINCINFIYNDGNKEKLIVDTDNNIIDLGDYKTSLTKDCTINKMSVNVYNSGVIDKRNNDSILIIDIPISSDLLKNSNLGIKVAYQFNSNTLNIKTIDFDS